LEAINASFGVDKLLAAREELTLTQTLEKARDESLRAFSIVCRACSTARRCKSFWQPDGGEVIAKRKGVVARRGLKAAWSKCTSRCTRTGSEAYGAGRAGNWSRSPYPSKALVVNPAVACGRRSNLPREICRLSRNRD